MPLVVTIEVLPGGDVFRSRTLAQMVIANDGEQGSPLDDPALGPEFGDYEFGIREGVEIVERGRVVGFRRAQGPWRLIDCCLRAAGLDGVCGEA